MELDLSSTLPTLSLDPSSTLPTLSLDQDSVRVEAGVLLTKAAAARGRRRPRL